MATPPKAKVPNLPPKPLNKFLEKIRKLTKQKKTKTKNQ